jgi:hypothetical protein
MEAQFSVHAIERVTGRMASVTNYAEVQRAVQAERVAITKRVLVKNLDRPVQIKDETADTGYVRGDKVFAYVQPVNGGLLIATVCLGF